jgi:hypothetical protein
MTEQELLASHVEWLRGDHERCNPWLADAIEAIAAERDKLAGQLADARQSVIAFGSVYAVRYAADFGYPEGHLNPIHYDILAEAGARMDSFTRAKIKDATTWPA